VLYRRDPRDRGQTWRMGLERVGAQQTAGGDQPSKCGESQSAIGNERLAIGNQQFGIGDEPSPTSLPAVCCLLVAGW